MKMLVQLLRFYERESTVISNSEYTDTCETIYQKHIHAGECFFHETVVQKFTEQRESEKHWLQIAVFNKAEFTFRGAKRFCISY